MFARNSRRLVLGLSAVVALACGDSGTGPDSINGSYALQTVNGKKYWQLTFAEDGAQAVQRRETFLVAERGDEILVRDFEKDTTLSLAQWRALKPVVR